MANFEKSFEVTGAANGRPYDDIYTFRFVWSSGHWVIRVLRRPADPFNNGVEKTHVWPDDRICIAAGREPRDADQAVAIAKFWASGYSQYVRLGGSVGNSGARVDV